MNHVESAQISHVGHDPVHNIMAVRFKAKEGEGALYHVENVTKDQYQQLLSAQSIGKHYNAHFKAHPDIHPATQL